MFPALVLRWSCWFGSLWKLTKKGTSGGSRSRECALYSCTSFQVLILLWGSTLLSTPNVYQVPGWASRIWNPLESCFCSHFVTIRKLNQVTVVRSLPKWKLPARWPPRQPSYFNTRPPPALWVAFDSSSRKCGCWPQDSCSRRLHSSVIILNILYGSWETSLLR